MLKCDREHEYITVPQESLMNGLMPSAMNTGANGKDTEKHPHVAALNRLSGKIFMREVFKLKDGTNFKNLVISEHDGKFHWDFNLTKCEFGEVDFNKNGVISKAELNRVYSEAYGEDAAAEFDPLDINKDGEVSKAEYDSFCTMKFKGEISKPEKVTLSRQVCSALDIPFGSAVAFFYPDPELSKSLLECEEDTAELTPHLELKKQALIRRWVDNDEEPENQALAMLLLSVTVTPADHA